jgi:four helix bundle protein
VKRLKDKVKKDFIAKLSIALKETNETEYWLELLKETAYIKTIDAEALLHDAMEIHRLLTAIIKSMKEKSSIND